MEKNKEIKIDRVWAMPNKNTFDIFPIKELIREEVNLNDLWIDPFANKNKFASITNDLNFEYDTDYHLDALEFLNMFDESSVDGVLYDPPYSPRQVSECYNNVGFDVTWDTTKASFWSNHKKAISRIVKVGGKVITFGWNSGGIGKKYGFEIERILLVPHGGWHNDTICTVEIKTRDVDPNILINKEEKDIKEKEVLTNNDKQLIEQLKKLPIDYWDFKGKDIKEYTHGIHTYPAIMASPISRNIINIVKNVQPVNSLFDPFSGSGTVLVEAMLSNIKNIAGNDINPLALLLIKAKTTLLNSNELNDAYEQLVERIDSKVNIYKPYLSMVDDYMSNKMSLDLSDKKGWGDNAPLYLSEFCKLHNIDMEIPNFKNIGYWFKPRVIIELAIIKSEIDKIKNTKIREYIYVGFSETIRLVSNRRNGEFKMYRMPKQKVLEFNPDVFSTFFSILERNIIKMIEFSEKMKEINSTSDLKIYNNDVCELNNIQDDSFDLIITSPPYGDSRTTVAYGEFSRLTLQWLNMYEVSEKEIMNLDKLLMGGCKYRNGFEFTLKSDTLKNSLDKIKDADLERAGDVYSFYKDLDKSLESVSKKTKSGGYQFWVVGNRTVKNELLKTDVIITELAPQYNLVPIYTIDRNIINKVMPSRNSPTNKTGKTNATMTMEHIVILRKK